LKTYVVSYISFFDNNLEMRKVEAESWQEAIHEAFDLGYFSEYNDIQNAKNDAFDMDFLFDVLEV
jgi:hypothetical protein